jgi:hypothetical protein
MGKYQQEFMPVHFLVMTAARNSTVCLSKYPPHPTSGYIHLTMQSDLSVALPESSGSGVVPTGTITWVHPQQVEWYAMTKWGALFCRKAKHEAVG